MPHGPELGIALLASFALAAGVGMRWVSKRVGAPYTVGMLLLGGAAGSLLLRWPAPLAYFGGEPPTLSADAILFLFLPALVFESAFALDVHAFRRNLATVAILALPAMIVTTFLTAGVVSLVAGPLWGWTLGAALVFGALISATDPVAVVAVLRELGAPKRLSLLIEGESLLNDGTAIVAFHVLLGLLVADHAFDAGGTLLTFVKVVLGGAAVGLVLASLASFWLARTFNDPLVEITVTVVLAYAAMAIAEGLLHVSGVIAIVTAGLFMAGPGQTRISPEVRRFLHRFWEMLAFLANTLIFFLVGLLISTQLEGASWSDLLIISGIYAAVVVIRFVVTFGFLPFLRATKEPVRVREGAVMAWGGLRGAVSLALALVVSQTDSLDPELRVQMLRVTAGVVLLTILVNGSTTGWLLKKLGFITPSPSEMLAREGLLARVLSETDRRLGDLAHDAELGALPWREVRDALEHRMGTLHGSIETLRASIGSGGEGERVREGWQRALRIEREAYWRSFSDGVLGRVALSLLAHSIDEQRDGLRAGRVDPPTSRAPSVHGLRSWLARRLRSLGVAFGKAEMGRLSLVYDISRAEAWAADAVIEQIGEGPPEVALTYRGWRRAAKHRIEAMRETFPEVVAAIEARLASRIELNLERDGLDALVRRGALSAGEAQAAREDIESRMKGLMTGPSSVELPETVDLCAGSALLRGLDHATLVELAETTIEQALAPGEVIFRQGDPGDAMYVIARGAIRLTRLGPDGEDHDVDVLATGEVLGEMALLGGRGRNATATASTGAVVGRIARKEFAALLDTRPEVRRRVFAVFARHALADAARSHASLFDLDHEALQRWLGSHEVEEADEREPDAPWTLLLRGGAERAGERIEGPVLLETGSGGWVLSGEIVRLGDPPVDGHREGLT